jgi:RNA polymerase sigma-70 factor (ECF subfamily)
LKGFVVSSRLRESARTPSEDNVREDLKTEDLLRRAAGGDAAALDALLGLHRARLKQMVKARMDRRLNARLDPSDVVQDALAEAWHEFPDYLRRRPAPFYPWLRQIAWQRLLQLHRLHVRTQKRSVKREVHWAASLPDHSAVELGTVLVAAGSSPSRHAARAELCAGVQAALVNLTERDREVLVLRHVEHLSTKEVAAILGIKEGAVRVRLLRALQRFRDVLQLELPGGEG